MVPLSIDYGTYNGWINEWIKEKYVLQGYLYRKNVPDNEYMLEILQVVETLHPGRQKEKKNAFKHYKNSSRLWMSIAVPDCHPKMPKMNKHENEKYFTVLDIRAW